MCRIDERPRRGLKSQRLRECVRKRVTNSKERRRSNTLSVSVQLHLFVGSSLLLAEELGAGLVGQSIDLVTQEGLYTAIDARDEPEDGIDEINPDRRLHGSRASSLVGLVAFPAKEDASKDAKHDDPGNEHGGIPRESAVGLCDLELAPDKRQGTDWHSNDEQHSGDGRQSSDEDGEDPLGGEAIVGLAISVDAVPVEATGDDGEEELQAAADEARDNLERLEPGLADLLARLSAVVEGVMAGLTTEVGLVGGAEVVGSASDAVG